MSGTGTIEFRDKSSRARDYYLPGAHAARSWYELCCTLLSLSRQTHSRREREATILQIHRSLYAIDGIVDISLAGGVIGIVCKPKLSCDDVHAAVTAVLTKHFGHVLDIVQK